MRHLFLIIMIALLPLRGWVGDAMATGMAATHLQYQSQTATNIIAIHAHASGGKAHFDLETVATEAARTAADCSDHASGGEPHAADTHCESCSVCQACHTVALSLTGTDVTGVLNLSTQPFAAGAQFASAETALGEKTPIS